MKARPYRLQVEEIEVRLTPSVTPTDVWTAMVQIQVNTETLKFITDDQLVGNPITLPYVENHLKAINEQNTWAISVLNEYMMDILNKNAGNVFTAEAYASTVVNVGGLINEGTLGLAYVKTFSGVLNLSLPATSVTTSTSGSTDNPAGNGSNGDQLTIDLTSDSGMVNTMPSINGFVDIGTGTKIKDVLVGQGSEATSNSTVSVYYTGWLFANGTQFDSRRSPNVPASFSLSGTIDGFKDGVAGMKPGGIRQIFIPSAEGYGNTGQGNVPPNADLVFEVKLITTS